MKYFINFVEEGIMNPDYAGFIGGRIEIYNDFEQYDIDEYRFLTKDIERFYRFRDRWDFKDVTKEQLDYIRRKTKKEFLVRVV